VESEPQIFHLMLAQSKRGIDTFCSAELLRGATGEIVLTKNKHDEAIVSRGFSHEKSTKRGLVGIAP
jgi:hypothetical protein